MSPLTCIVADDEPHLRSALIRQLHQHWPELKVIAEAANGVETLELVNTHQPQMLFLDIEMPGLNGIEVARQLMDHNLLIVFITAYDHYAVDAFEAAALDYLLKPVQSQRLQQCLSRIQQRLEINEALDSQRLIAVLEQLHRPPVERLKWLKVSRRDQIELVAVDEVLFFQSDQKYTRLVTSESEGLIRLSIKELLTQLDPQQFWQIHRGVIVRVDAIERAERNELGNMELTLQGSEERLPVSRNYAHLFRSM